MGTQNRIKKLEIKTFRGATQPVVFEFQTQQPIVLIFGENGSGKSTIADALDFVCNNNFGSLNLRSGTTPKSHVVSATGRSQDLEVNLLCGGNSWQAKLISGKPVTIPSTPPRAFILRRADITRVMEVTDGDRYKNLKEFITLPQIEVAESALRTAYKFVTEELNQSIRQKNTAETTLRSYWIAEGKPQSGHIEWARTTANRSVNDIEQQIFYLKKLRDKVKSVVASEIELTIAENRYGSFVQERTRLENQLRETSRIQPNVDLVLTLQAAKSYLHKHPETDRCPVCTKPEAYDSLVSQIESQLTQLQEVQLLHNQIDQNKTVLQQAEGNKNAVNQKWLSAGTELITLLSGGPPAMVSGLPDISNQASPEILRPYLNILEQNALTLDSEISQKERIVAQQNALITHLATINQLTDTVVSQYAISNRLKAMLDIAEQERKRFVQDTVNNISCTVSQLYARVHPDELIGEPIFGVKSGTIGSLTMKGKFGPNNDVPPVAYYSEAHLDTLGLCVYLALAKQSGNAVVVLDDVLMSVDDPHLDRVIDLINEEAPNFGHVIITTHSRAWFDRVRLGRGMCAELIELYGWDLHNGMHHSRAPLAVEDLRDAVNALKVDRQLIASRAGILMEQLLDDLTLRYGMKLPRKQTPHYTLGELADGIDKNLRKLLRCEHLDGNGVMAQTFNLFPLIEAATSDAWIRNQVGAHFNLDAAGISDNMIRTFGASVLAFADAILCKQCHQIPCKNKSGSYWECGAGCGKIRLYPLVTP
jgi:energy-coupling factor transporter ATP-binding protein EcfA2